MLLAPMAGYTDSAFRQLCREYGADILMTELISADAIAYGKLRIKRNCRSSSDAEYTEIDSHLEANSRNEAKSDKVIVEGKNHSTAEMLSFSEAERPIVVQLFGKYPEKFASAAKWISEELRPDGIDINMGCPARKVVGSDHGAALLKNPELALEIVHAVKSNTNLPVSVKTRLGWDDDDQIMEFAPRLVEAGARAIIVHGRTYKDGFKGRARWENIYNLKIQTQKQEVSIIGNGDIQSYQEALERADGGPIKLDGVAIGRATFGRPQIFMNNEPKMSSGELGQLILRHAELVWQSKGDFGMVEFRKHLLAYLKGFDGAKEMRKEAVCIQTLSDVEKVLSKIGNEVNIIT